MKKTKKTAMQVFENMSIVLTGFSNADITGTGLTSIYFDTITKKIGEEKFKDLLEAFQRIEITNLDDLSSKECDHVQELITHITYKTISSQIIKLWYLGQWTPSDIHEKPQIISSKSYLEGLVWKAIGAHPMGGKQQGFGTWGFPPLTFSSKPSKK